MSTYANKVVETVLKITEGPVPNHAPVIDHKDITCVVEQLRDFGSYGLMEAFESRLAEVCDRRHAVAVASGSAGLELGLTALSVGPGDLVMVPAISFVAAANAVRRLGATPLFVDVELVSYGMDPEKLAVGLQRLKASRMPLPRAIVAVHVLGHPCRIQDILDVAFLHRIHVIEDAAEALGSSVYVGPDEDHECRPCGTFGCVSVASFNVNKIVTSGGGGAVLTDNDDIALRVRHLATTARIPHRFEIAHDPGGWNDRMSMLSSALAYSQLQRLLQIVAAKRALAAAYREVFAWRDEVEFFEEPPDTVSNFWLPSIKVRKEEREAVLTALNDAGLGSRALFTPIPRLASYQTAGASYPVADEAHATTVCLPAGIELARRFV